MSQAKHNPQDLDLKSQLDAAELVFMDCDGVIFDSNGFKIEAMTKVLADYPEHWRQQMADYWRNNGGMSRHAKFEYFFSEIAKSDDAPERTQQAISEFGAYSLQGYAQLQPLRGAIEFARQVERERLYVVSGADQDELRQVFRGQSIDVLFTDVLGSPRTKSELVQHVLADSGVDPKRTLLIGDGRRDYETCRQLGMYFVYLSEHSEWTGAEEVLASAPNVSRAASWKQLLWAFGISR